MNETDSKSIRTFAVRTDIEQPTAIKEKGLSLYSKRRPRGGERPHTLCPKSPRAFCNQLGVATTKRNNKNCLLLSTYTFSSMQQWLIVY